MTDVDLACQRLTPSRLAGRVLCFSRGNGYMALNGLTRPQKWYCSGTSRGKNQSVTPRKASNGAWRSPVAHLLWEQGVPSSNLGAPTVGPLENKGVSGGSEMLEMVPKPFSQPAVNRIRTGQSFDSLDHRLSFTDTAIIGPTTRSTC